MNTVELRSVTKSFGAVSVIKNIDLVVREGEFVVFVGPSGSGKSTLLRMIAGLETVVDGVIMIDGKDVTHAEPADRGIAMVFQSYALYPHMNVYENIAFNLRLSRLSKAEIDKRVREAARILKLDELLQRSPAQLSGGQRQRVAIGRAIVRHPKVFLFDEPLSNLDASLRGQMRLEIERLHRELGTTMIYVTHDQVEAMTLADRIVALDGGRIQQIGAPMELYAKPANRFVAGFIGSPSMNFFAGVLTQGAAGSARIKLAAEADMTCSIGAGHDGPVTIGIRPEAIEISQPGEKRGRSRVAMRARIELIERLGNITFAHLELQGGESAVVQLPGNFARTEGDAVSISFLTNQAIIFGPTGAAIAINATNNNSR